MLAPVVEGVWEQRATCRFRGIRLSRRTTVVRLADGGLWVHSPNALQPDLRAALEALGPVAHVVAPNTHHHAHLDAWREAFPQAAFHGAPALIAKRPELPLAHALDADPLPWADDLETLRVEGAPGLDEFVFFHRPSATLIVADLLFRFTAQDSWLTRLVARVDGTYRRVFVSRDLRRTLIRDRAAFQRSAAAICAWPVERLLMAHCQEVATPTPGELRAAFGLATGPRE